MFYPAYLHIIKYGEKNRRAQHFQTQYNVVLSVAHTCCLVQD